MKPVNSLLGRKLVFGDQEQIQALESFGQEEYVTNYGPVPPFGEEPVWTCPYCNTENQTRKIATRYSHARIRTPWVYQCRSCNQGRCMYWRQDNMGEPYVDWETGDYVLLRRLLAPGEPDDIESRFHQNDPLDFSGYLAGNRNPVANPRVFGPVIQLDLF